MKKLLFILLSLAVFTACERKIDNFTVSKGSADFSKFIAVGNSIMAGYADGALYLSGQENSIPNLIAGQLKMAGGGDFIQPLVNSESGIAFPGLNPKLVLGLHADCLGETSLSPVPSTGTLEPFQPVGYAVNNFSVPGAKSFHFLFPHYGDAAGLMTIPPTANPYFVRFSQTPATTVLGDAMAANATFFTMLLGDNDVLSYALSGGAGDTITSPGFFQTAMGGVLQGLTSNGAKGVISTIPDVCTIPFFTTIPYNGLVLDRQSLVDSINGFMVTYFNLPNLADYHLGQNPFLISDPAATNPFKVRKMVPGELVLLSVPQDSLKCVGWGIISRTLSIPFGLPNQFTLTLDEVAALQTATAAYNQIIPGLAGTFGLGLVDLNAKLKELQKGIVWNGIKMNTEFVTGGVFSLDGVHLNPRGSAIVANYFIDAINAKYGSKIPAVDVTKYPGVLFP
jgi:hypothetical protein